MINLKQIFPNASDAFIAANSRLQDSKLERSAGDEPSGADEGKEAHSKRFVLRYTSYRCQLITDYQENTCTKFFTDALRYCGAIPDDTGAVLQIQFIQKKVDHRNEEKTLIELFQ